MSKDKFPKEYPFWARMKISKRRTTLVIDDTKTVNKKTKKVVDGFVHREATHTFKSSFEKITPNPDESDSSPMYLRSPRKLPQSMFEVHNKNLKMPKHLRDRYYKERK